jgi:hypothetical protein
MASVWDDWQRASDAAVAAARAYLQTCKRPSCSTYPFGNPVSADASHAARLKCTSYLVTDKSDGVRVCIVFCRTPDGTPVAVAFDRTMQDPKGVPAAVDVALFDGTVLDCELVAHKHTGCALVLPFDTCALLGDVDGMTRADLPRRLAAMTDVLPRTPLDRGAEPSFLQAPVVRRSSATVQFHVKSMLPITRGVAGHMTGVVLPSLPYGTDGFVLTPSADGPTPPGIAPAVLKLKVAHTLDFWWDGCELWFGEQADMAAVSVEWPTLAGCMPAVHMPPSVPPCTVVEVKPLLGPQRDVIGLQYVGTRVDKTHPNSYRTVTRTLTSIKDNVRLADVVAWVTGVKKSTPRPA